MRLKLAIAGVFLLLLTAGFWARAETVFVFIPTQTVSIVPYNQWQVVAHDFDILHVGGQMFCKYGTGDADNVYLMFASGTFQVLPTVFGIGDPALGVQKALQCWSGPNTPPAANYTPILAPKVAPVDKPQ